MPCQDNVSIHALTMISFGSNRLFLMLQRFPVESKGRRKKLQEVFCESYCLDYCYFASADDVLFKARLISHLCSGFCRLAM